MTNFQNYKPKTAALSRNTFDSFCTLSFEICAESIHIGEFICFLPARPKDFSHSGRGFVNWNFIFNVVYRN